MNYILVSDLHLTSNALDEYRWRWLYEFTVHLREYNSRRAPFVLIILGDITESKDRHSSILVNRFIDYFQEWAFFSKEVIIVAGNHDGLDASKPFFRFINNIDKVSMISTRGSRSFEGMSADGDIDKLLFLAHSKKPVEDWKDIDFNSYDYVFMHQSTERAKTSNNFEIEHGLPYSYFNEYRCKVFSGDIHVPQEVGKVTYVGSPYPIYFGDHFQGRYGVIENHRVSWKSISSIHKWKLNITDVKQLRRTEINEGDQLSIEFTIERTEQHRWPSLRKSIREYVREKEASLVSLQLIVPRSNVSLSQSKRVRLVRRGDTDEGYVMRYSKNNNLDALHTRVALDIMRGDKNDA